jgi:hypothetical protein
VVIFFPRVFNFSRGSPAASVSLWLPPVSTITRMRMALAQATLLLASAAVAAGDSPSFAAWSRSNGRSYSSTSELVYRRSIYAANVATIDAHNARNASWLMGVNQFSDLTGAEFKSGFTGGYKPAPPSARGPVWEPSIIDAPVSVDWRTRGAVTPVKDQGGCGSCWAFSATGAIEGAHFIASKKLADLSEQQLVSCDSSNGCGGGSMQSAFQWVIRNRGQCSEKEYPCACAIARRCYILAVSDASGRLTRRRCMTATPHPPPSRPNAFTPSRLKQMSRKARRARRAALWSRPSRRSRM